MAVVDKAESEVVPELGVPLIGHDAVSGWFLAAHQPGHTAKKMQAQEDRSWGSYGPISEGVTGSEGGGGGKLIKVGLGVVIAASREGSSGMEGNTCDLGRWIDR